MNLAWNGETQWRQGWIYHERQKTKTGTHLDWERESAKAEAAHNRLGVSWASPYRQRCNGVKSGPGLARCLQECYEAERVVTLYGGMDEVERDFVKQAFNNRSISVRRQLGLNQKGLARVLAGEFCYGQPLGKRPSQAVQAGPGAVGCILWPDD